MSKTFAAALTLAAAQAFSTAQAGQPGDADLVSKIGGKLSTLMTMDKSTPKALVAIDQLFAGVTAEEGKRFVEIVYGGKDLPEFGFRTLQENNSGAVVAGKLGGTIYGVAVPCAVINPVEDDLVADEAAANAENLLGFLKLEKEDVSAAAYKNLVASQQGYIGVMNQAAAACAKAAPKP